MSERAEMIVMGTLHVRQKLPYSRKGNPRFDVLVCPTHAPGNIPARTYPNSALGFDLQSDGAIATMPRYWRLREIRGRWHVEELTTEPKA